MISKAHGNTKDRVGDSTRSSASSPLLAPDLPRVAATEITRRRRMGADGAKPRPSDSSEPIHRLLGVGIAETVSEPCVGGHVCDRDVEDHEAAHRTDAGRCAFGPSRQGVPALTDATAVASLFNITTRYADALGFAIPTAAEFDRTCDMLLKRGYE